MSISQWLCEVRDRKYGGTQLTMAKDWGVNQATLSRWIRGDRVPDPTSYDFLSRKLGLSIEEVHRACQIARTPTTAAPA